MVKVFLTYFSNIQIEWNLYNMKPTNKPNKPIVSALSSALKIIVETIPWLITQTVRRNSAYVTKITGRFSTPITLAKTI